MPKNILHLSRISVTLLVIVAVTPNLVHASSPQNPNNILEITNVTAMTPKTLKEYEQTFDNSGLKNRPELYKAIRSLRFIPKPKLKLMEAFPPTYRQLKFRNVSAKPIQFFLSVGFSEWINVYIQKGSK
tara:strand:- start:784 stop:1170 length:387 start_codon:yes stop_codon:yes gene_type:complete